MSQLFHPSTNPIARVTIFGGAIIGVVVLLSLYAFIRSDYYTDTRNPIAQPVPFSHQRHVAANGIDCRYCHTSVEESAFAGIPPTETCMTCHSQILSDAPLLEPVRTSFAADRPIAWVRVHDLPDYAYFNHSIHLSSGVGCTTCHGPIDRMRLTWKENTLQMAWCLDCHRAPQRFLRPREEVFNVNYQPPADQIALGSKLIAEYDIQVEQLTDCSICHR